MAHTCATAELAYNIVTLTWRYVQGRCVCPRFKNGCTSKPALSVSSTCEQSVFSVLTSQCVILLLVQGIQELGIDGVKYQCRTVQWTARFCSRNLYSLLYTQSSSNDFFVSQVAQIASSLFWYLQTATKKHFAMIRHVTTTYQTPNADDGHSHEASFGRFVRGW